MKIIGTHENNTIEQLKEVDKNAIQTALMADGHLGYVMPIGGVAAYDNQVSPVGVGFDIACGNCAIKTDIKVEDIDSSEIGTTRNVNSEEWCNIASEIQRTISFGVGKNNDSKDAPKDHSLFDSEAWKILDTHNRDRLKKLARNQLGTVGSGNHYVDIFSDENNNVWVGVHFGSRGLGYKIASGFLNLSQGRKFDERGAKEIECLLNINDNLGADYWELMNLAGEYAYAGRDWVAMKVVEMLGGRLEDYVHNHHNFAWKEVHNINGSDTEVVVIRKGATPAFPRQRGFVGGSMGDNSVILEGSDVDRGIQIGFNKLQRPMMYSTVHGAGRVMSRSEAKGKRTKAGVVKRNPRVTNAMMADWIKKKDVILIGGGVDESPHVYRRLTDVLKDQGPTINILHTLKPIVVVMA